MTSETLCPRDLCDRDVLAALASAAAAERQATARLIELLAEVDSRRLYAQQGCSSLFSYCVQVLHFSEHAAYLRIEAARAVRRFPAILGKLGDGSLHLTAISLLSPHLTAENFRDVLDEATHKSKRDVERLVARVRPQPDVPTVVRKLPTPPVMVVTAEPAVERETLTVAPTQVTTVLTPARRPEIKPLAPDRYKIQFTVSRDTHEKLRRIQDLMRHIVPDGDPAAIFDRALTLLLAELSRAKCGEVQRPQDHRAPNSRSRHIPAAVKRDVWARDGGQCAFRGEQGRCAETGFLEFHHVVPFADGGETSVANIQLRCRSHNQYEADLWSGGLRAPQVRETRAEFGG